MRLSASNSAGGGVMRFRRHPSTYPWTALALAVTVLVILVLLHSDATLRAVKGDISSRSSVKGLSLQAKSTVDGERLFKMYRFFRGGGSKRVERRSFRTKTSPPGDEGMVGESKRTVPSCPDPLHN